MPVDPVVAAGEPGPSESDAPIELAVLTCAGCSACCEEQGMPPGYVVPSLLTFLPEALRDELEHHLREERVAEWTRHERGLPCIWLDPETKLCRHYDLRPERCRDFKVGGDGCSFWRERRTQR